MKKILLMLALITLTAAYASTDAIGQQTKKTTEMKPVTKNATLQAAGKCDMCKKRIEKAALSVEGVSTASWDLKKKQLSVDFDPAKTSLDSISKAVAKAGHDTEKYKADQATYDALPSCCKYR